MLPSISAIKIISETIKKERIDICCLQEIDLVPDYNIKLLSFKGYELITERNRYKMRTGMYIRNEIKYTRQSTLEGTNNGLISLDTYKIKFKKLFLSHDG